MLQWDVCIVRGICVTGALSALLGVACGDDGGASMGGTDGSGGQAGVASTTTTGGGGAGGKGGPSPTCSDGLMSPGESDVDCGGLECAPCGIGRICTKPSDCLTNTCVQTPGSGGVESFCFPVHLMSVAFWGSDDVIGKDIALKADGSIVLGGYFEGTANFGLGDVTSQESDDAFALELAPSGALAWARAVPGAGWQRVKRVELLENAPVLIGFTGGSVDFGAGALPPKGANDLFVARLDETGGTTWAKLFGGIGNEVIQDAATSPSDSLVLVGEFLDTTDFGTGQLSDAGEGDIFVANVSDTGNTLTASRFGGIARDWAFGASFDDEGNLIVVGKSEGHVDFGSVSLSAPSADVFLYVVKLNGTSDEPIWSRTFDLGVPGGSISVAVDDMNDVVVVGDFAFQSNFGDGPIVDSAYVAKFDGTTGTTAWVRTYGGDDHKSRAYDVETRGTDIFVSGHSSGAAAFGHPHLTDRAFLVKLDSVGNVAYGIPIGAARLRVQGPYAAITGTFLGKVNFGGDWLGSTKPGVNTALETYVAKFELP